LTYRPGQRANAGIRVAHYAARDRANRQDGSTDRSVHQLVLCTLTGNYLEATPYLLPDGERIAQLAPELFVRPAPIIQLPDCAPGYAITAGGLAAINMRRQPRGAILVSTDWERMWDAPRFVDDSSHFAIKAMECLIALHRSIIRGEIPCFDHSANPVGVNYLLFEAGCLILVRLVSLRQVAMEQPLLVALSLLLQIRVPTPGHCRDRRSHRSRGRAHRHGTDGSPL
jgi:kynurenine formamidase